MNTSESNNDTATNQNNESSFTNPSTTQDDNITVSTSTPSKRISDPLTTKRDAEPSLIATPTTSISPTRPALALTSPAPPPPPPPLPPDALSTLQPSLSPTSSPSPSGGVRSVPSIPQRQTANVISTVLAQSPTTALTAASMRAATSPGSRRIVVTTAVLIISRNQDCDKPLKEFLILYVIRVVIACPVNLYLTLNPRDNNTRSDQNNAARRERWVDKLKSFLDLFATLWFIIGNYFLFTTDSCRKSAPSVFWLSLAWVILGYIIITIPILLCLAVIFCLPCVLVAMRILHVSDAVGMGGASEDAISKVPTVKYRAPTSEGGEGENEAQRTTADETTVSIVDNIVPADESSIGSRPSTPKRKKKFIFFKKNKPSSMPLSSLTPTYLTIKNPEDAVCSICLSSYEDEEELRHLWCGHHFHKDCVDEWLRLNRRYGAEGSGSNGSNNDVADMNGAGVGTGENGEDSV
ncbi:9142_t:CDS:2 [Paraglomus occultum]|uniref:9142_t:CDS:1 n=1 Tax=Paraglomus occultum TaxID=144539 RepID=A0A9N8ZG74_9GLOM|nr:9142_t:CDS:2 [Paraglomus occultum]